MKLICCLAAGLILFSTTMAQPPKFDNPKIVLPDEKTMELIKHRQQKLQEAIDGMPKNTPDYVRVDVEIYAKAVEWALRHNDIFDGGKAMVAVLEQGLLRAKDALDGKAPWQTPKGKVVARAYRSKVDGSLQPYAVAYPPDYAKDKKTWRLDIVLHGRDSTICETKFLNSHNGKDSPKDNDFVQIDIYGRGNNAYRWAGETDVWEVIENFISVESKNGRNLIDPKRMVIRGFSMGGAGTWHLGLQHPDRWCVMGPGAGFTTTHSYVKTLPNPLPDSQEPLLHIYDALDYAENAASVPVVAYSGEIDAQKAAADHIENKLKELKIPMTHLIGPGLAHAFPAEQVKRAEAEWVKYAGPGKGRPAYPEQIRFVTYTLKFPKCDWVMIGQMEKHYEQARVEGAYHKGAITLQTRNVKVIAVNPPPDNPDVTLTIDGQKFGPSTKMILERRNSRWSEISVKQLAFGSGQHKEPGMTGPIDDAFTTSFLCVKGSGSAWSDLPAKSADAQLTRFEKEWNKWLRGKLTIKTDKEVTEDDIKTKNLILFGDPSSNSLIGKVLPKLPVTWSKDELVVGGQKYESAKYLPMLVYPNPLNPSKYVVLNSGHTFHEADFKGTNALLFPKLGDYAVVRPIPTEKDPAGFEVMKSGIFTDEWKFDK